MKTHELLAASETALTPIIKEMKLKELERHAQKILLKLGQSDYDNVLKVIIRAVPKLDPEKIDRFTAVQNLIRGLVPTASNDSEEDQKVIACLAVIIMRIISQKFDKIMSTLD